MCLGKLLCSHLPPVETANVLEVVGQVQLLLTGTGWLSLVNSKLANQAKQTSSLKKGQLVSPGGKPETEPYQWLHQSRSSPLAKTLRHSKSEQASHRHTDTQTHAHAHARLSGNKVVKCSVQSGQSSAAACWLLVQERTLASDARCIAWGVGKNNKNNDNNKAAFACDFQSKAKTALYARTPIRAHASSHSHTHTDTDIQWHSDAISPLLCPSANLWGAFLRSRAGRRTSMLLARSHDLMHFAASSGCSWQRLQPCVPHASRQHWHASLHAPWCCG